MSWLTKCREPVSVRLRVLPGASQSGKRDPDVSLFNGSPKGVIQ